MKKEITILLFTIILISFVSSAQISLNKEEFFKKETLIAGISGEFTESITEEDVYLYRNWNRVPFDVSVIEIGDMFFISGILSVSASGNYTIQVENVEYKEENIFTDSPISKNFIINNEIANFNINPGVIKTQESFFISFENLINKKITINPRIENNPDLKIADEIVLNPLETKEVFFNKVNKTGFYNLILEGEKTTYKVPLHTIYDSEKEIIEEGTGKKTTKENQGIHSISFEKNQININMLKSSNNSQKIILITNKGNFSENISLFVSEPLKDYITIKEKNFQLSSGDSKNIILNISSSAKESNFKGELRANSENASDLIEIYLEFFENQKNLEQEEEKDNPPASQNCSELGGEICKDDEKCIGRTMKAKNGVCCLEECKKKEGNITGKIIGWIILVVILLLVYWIYKKYKKTQKDFNISDQLKKLSNLKNKKIKK